MIFFNPVHTTYCVFFMLHMYTVRKLKAIGSAARDVLGKSRSRGHAPVLIYNASI